MKKSLAVAVLAFLSATPAAAQNAAGRAVATESTPTCPQIAGWVETASIADPPRALEAKLDTGADTSALSATAMTSFQRDGVTWVRFQLTAGSPESAVIETPLIRWARVRRAGTKTDRRPVVSLPLCLAGLTTTAEFTLTDRTGLDYPVLIGRAALAGRIAIDPARTHIAPATCPR